MASHGCQRAGRVARYGRVFGAVGDSVFRRIFAAALAPRAHSARRGRKRHPHRAARHQTVPAAAADRPAGHRRRFPLICHYANLLYINNGYDFFSPDPTVSHIIRYEVFDDRGQTIAKGDFPNTREQWPRLLYHRYMMLVDQSSNPQNADTGWEYRIADGLLERYGGANVRLTKKRHHLLMPSEVLAGHRLNEDSTYEVIGQLERRRGEPRARRRRRRPDRHPRGRPMRAVIGEIMGYFRELWQAWNRFWFQPADPATLSLIRVLAGGMLLYTHFIWSFDLSGFIGPDGYTPVEFLRHQIHVPPAGPDNPNPVAPWSLWSMFFWIQSTWLLWTVHVLALIVFFCLFVGLFSRTAAVLGYFLAVSYVNRVTPGAFFGLDKTNCMMAMYLLLGPCGARYSLDRLWRLKRGGATDPEPSTSANLAIRLMQVHLCVMYLFSGLAKMQGATWQMGTAVWWAAASYEYQALDLTWLAAWPVLTALADPRHGVLGNVLLLPGLEPIRPADRLMDGRGNTWRDRSVFGNDHLWPGDDFRQPVVPQADDRAALGRPHRQPRVTGTGRAQSQLSSDIAADLRGET